MNQKLLTVQAVACGVLSLILLAEWSYGQFARNQLQATLEQKKQADYQAENLPELNMPNQSLEQFSAVTERPLFIEGRKPIVENPQNETQQNVDNGQIDDWLLIGVYNKGKHKQAMALFRKQNESKKYLKLSAEQMISGWQLQKIEPDRVVLLQGGQQKTVLLRKPRTQIKPQVPRMKPTAPAVPASPPMPAENNPLENSDNDSE